MYIQGRTVAKTIVPMIGKTLLDHALQEDIDMGFSCARGTCARCRCWIKEGGALLAPPTDAEWDRLEEQELADGYRLGCQAVVITAGQPMHIVHKPYF